MHAASSLCRSFPPNLISILLYQESILWTLDYTLKLWRKKTLIHTVKITTSLLLYIHVINNAVVHCTDHETQLKETHLLCFTKLFMKLLMIPIYICQPWEMHTASSLCKSLFPSTFTLLNYVLHHQCYIHVINNVVKLVCYVMHET